MAFLLDSDPITILQKPNSRDFPALEAWLQQCPPSDLFVPIVSFQEQIRGWLGTLNRKQDGTRTVWAFAQLEKMLRYYCGCNLLPFDQEAQDRFDSLRRQGVKIGTQDLRIASIALTTGCTLVSRNLKDFQKVPGLQVEDWTT